MRFIHLRVHSEFSLVDGLPRVKPLVKRAAELKMPALAVTDQFNLFALVKFYKAALAVGVKPIAGADVWLFNEADVAAPHRLTLLAQHLDGYRSLTRLLSRGYIEGQHQGVPMLRPEWLEEANAGLIVLSGGREGPLAPALLTGNAREGRAQLERWLSCLGERFYLEVQRTGRPGEAEYNEAAVHLAAENGVPLAATNDVRFLHASDFEAHEARVCIQQGRVLDDPRRPRIYSEQQYLRSPEEMTALFADLPEALENTVEIAKRCNLELNLDSPSLPDFPLPDGVALDDFFAEQSRSGLAERLRKSPPCPKETPDSYRERLETELAVIRQMGFAGYFLIVADFVHWAKVNRIPVGPGRGSGAGSLVAYALSITDLDPLEFDLLFERFLNPERVSMPDFDVDFCMERRDEVIDYVAQKYGCDKVAQIITHGSMAAKAVVRDVGRVLGHPYGFVDKLAKLIPFELGITLDKALADSEDLRAQYEGDEEVRALIDMAKSLEGLARNAGTHAGGVVIAPSSLTDFAPLYSEAGGEGLVTQFDKDDVEAIGLVKFDFLGLRTLTIIDWALDTVNRGRQGRGEPPVDITQIPRDDAKSFALLKSCQTTAVFQLESRGMKDLIRRLQPDCFEDIIALVALFRPGPLQSGMVDDFIARKQGRARVAYPHPSLEQILKPTYGVIVYQEQVMQIAQTLAGYTLGGADLLRRAMGKKKPEEMAQQRDIFVGGAVVRGVVKTTATYIFDLMEKFAEYGFNKSHSAAYALVAYQTAWLKAHYPAEFMAAVLSADMDNTDKVVVLIEECREMKRIVLPPDINRSEFRFAVQPGGAILYGLGAIKGVGEAAISDLLAERGKSGAFADLVDLCRRIDSRKANRRVLEALIKAGAFDSLDTNRAKHFHDLPAAMKMAEQHGQMDISGQNDLFGLGAEPAAPIAPTAPVADVEPWPEEVRLAEEKATLGLYLTGHPIERRLPELAQFVTCRLGKLGERLERANGRNEPHVVVAGLAVEMRTRQNKQGKRMAFITLDDRGGRVEVAVFAEVFERFREWVSREGVLVVEGALAMDDFSQQPRLTAEWLGGLDEARERFARALLLRWTDERHKEGGAGAVAELRDLISAYRGGRCPVRVEFGNGAGRTKLRLGEAWQIRPAETLLQELGRRFGADAARLVYEQP
jgi:DNA polymerase-3 subunit alpha